MSPLEIALRVAFALSIIIPLGRAFGTLLARYRQPAVMGEVLAGILLGPSLIGAKASSAILPGEIAPILSVIAQAGVTIFMFLVGLEINAGQLRHRAGAILAIGNASIACSFVLGLGLAKAFHGQFSPSDVSFWNYAMFLGVALSITAFPIMARILHERGLTHTDLGMMALGSAAAGDATAWCLLAVVISTLKAQSGGVLWVLTTSIGYVALMFFVIRPLILRYVANRPATPLMFLTVLLAIFISAKLSERAGFHAIFGAFTLGALIPHDCEIAETIGRRLSSFARTYLLPPFFAFSGMRTQIDLVNDANSLVACLAVIVAAMVGKILGTYVAGRLCRIDHSTALTLGVLMNAKGLMELIVLNVGLDLGLITPKFFAIMVLMALVTTFSTGPLLNLTLPSSLRLAPRPAQ